MRLLISCFIFLTLFACEEEVTPDYLIEENVYIDLLVELQIIKSYSYLDATINSDSIRIDILTRYSVSKDDFLKSHMYYQQDGPAQMKRIDKAIERIKIIEDEYIRAEQDSTKQN